MVAKETEAEIAETNRAIKAIELLKADRLGEFSIDDANKRILEALIFKKSRASFFFFAKYVLDFDLLSEQTHRKWAEDLQKTVKANKHRVMRLKCRGSYKTTLYGISFVLWLWAIYSPQLRIFYTSANSLLLEEVSDKINQFVGSDKESTLYSQIFDITRDMSAQKNTSDIFNIRGRSGKGFSLILKTAGGSSVGIHPNIIIIDDPLDKNDRESEATRRQKENWFDSLIPLLVPFKTGSTIFDSIFYIGTRWHFDDLVSYILKMNEDETNDDNKWDIETESLENSEGKSNYPEFFPDSRIQMIKKSMSSIFYSCQFLNNPLSEEIQVFDLKKFSFVRPDQFFPEKNQDSTISLEGISLCVFDPSLGKKASDYPAVLWLNFHNNYMTFFDAIDKKMEISFLLNLIAMNNKKYRIKTLLYENNGIMLVEENIKAAHERIGVDIYIESIRHTAGMNKPERIRSMQPDLHGGSVRFMSDYKERYPEAMNQIIFYPAYKNDDFPDCAEMGIEYFRKPIFQFIRYEGLL